MQNQLMANQDFTESILQALHNAYDSQDESEEVELSEDDVHSSKDLVIGSTHT